MINKKKLIIIGAGISGLSCADKYSNEYVITSRAHWFSQQYVPKNIFYYFYYCYFFIK